MSEIIEQALLSKAMAERYRRYAMSVITSRALPDVRDGLKPVQRRILYAMETNLGLGGGDASFRKSAGVVGTVMTLYHPHGDLTIYETLARMAQPFSLRYALVDPKGNFGSIAGDPPGAMRYTECRLKALSSDLMAQLAEDTVPLIANFDGRAREPVVLPVPVPLLLVNGSTGIAVGMATNIPPHNLAEVCKAAAHLVEEPEATVAQLLQKMRGPDFPTGGELVTKRDELRAIYETGRGSVKLRGTYTIEEGTRGAKALVIDSIPYGTTTEAIVKAIADIIDAKRIPHAVLVRDESGSDVRILVHMKRDADPGELAAYLFKHTPLQINYNINLTCLAPDPEDSLAVRPLPDCDLKSMLRHFLDFRFDVVTRSLQFRLNKLRERIHILDGFVAVYSDIDAFLKIVRKSDGKEDAARALMKRFSLDEVQVDAILELKIYRIARLEIEKIKEERARLDKEAKRLEKLLAGTKPRWNIVKEDLLAFGEKHGDKRRTKLVFSDELVYDAEAYIAKEDTNVVVTRLGFMKRVRSLKDPQATRVREDDQVGWILQGSARSEGAYFSSTGSAYVAKLNDAPATTGYGDPIQKLFKFGDGEKVVATLSLDTRITPADGETLLVATAHGNVLRTPLAPHRQVSTRAGRKFVRLDDGDEVVSVELVPEGAKDIVLVSKKGMAARFPLEEAPLVAGVGKGLRGMKLDPEDRLLVATLRPGAELETDRGARFKLSAKDLEPTTRGSSGTAVKERGGFTRAIPPEPELIELEKLDGKAE